MAPTIEISGTVPTGIFDGATYSIVGDVLTVNLTVPAGLGTWWEDIAGYAFQIKVNTGEIVRYIANPDDVEQVFLNKIYDACELKYNKQSSLTLLTDLVDLYK